MSNRTIQVVVALAVISIVGIIVVQAYWVRTAYHSKEIQFNQSVNIALRTVAQRIAALNQMAGNPQPVNQITSDYYVVNVNSAIDANVLEHYLKTEFDRHNLHIDYEYGIYDCANDKMVYGNYVQSRRNDDDDDAVRKTTLPKWDEYTYYFGIRFPTKSSYLASQMGFWVLSSALLLAVIVFFGYALMVILRQKRLSEVQRDFVNNMTHEFKTPIATIGISADLISNPQILQKPEAILNYANIIKTQNTRLKNHVERVLQMAALDRGKLKLNLEAFGLHEVLTEIVQNFNLQAQAQISIDNRLPKPEARILADRVHLTNIIYNLLDNAVKYTDRPPEIRIGLWQTGKQLHLTVSDNGIGIAKADQKRVFEKFFRVPTGNVHNVKGFGLGLDYVRQIVRAHRWRISLQSQPNEGSTFEIVMPVASA